MIKVGLTGGIGSGKSTVSKILISKGFSVYNSDNRAKWLMNNDDNLKYRPKKEIEYWLKKDPIKLEINKSVGSGWFGFSFLKFK